MSTSGVSCPICLDNFDDPRILACGHSYCFECLKGIIRSEGSSLMQCPKRCRLTSPLSQRNLEQLPVNYDLKASMDELKSVQEKSEEEQCAKHKMTMQGFCSICSSLVCFGCVTGTGNHHYHECKPIQQCTRQINNSISAEEEKADRLGTELDEELQSVEKEMERLTEIRNNLRNGLNRIRSGGKVVKNAKTVTQKWMKSRDLKTVYDEVLKGTGIATMRMQRQPTMAKREEALDLRIERYRFKPLIHAVPIDDLLSAVPQVL